MVKRLKSLRLQFLVIALSLAVITTVLGLSAYLVDTKSYSGVFKTAAGSDLGFLVTGTPYNNTENPYQLTPGDTLPVNATAQVDGNLPMYVFVEIDVPANCSYPDLNTTFWTRIDKTNVYYYGNNGTLSALGGSYGKTPVSIIPSITLDDSAEIDQSFSFTITGYAIQQKNLEDRAGDPKGVFNLAKSKLEGGT